MRKVFVTGAEGFPGAALSRQLVQRGFEVVAGVWNRSRKLQLEKTGLKALVCDVSDAINVARCIASVGPDAVIHLAGTNFDADSVAEPLQTYQATTSAWANVLDAARRAVPRARLLMTSSAAVYGNASPSGSPINESSPLRPNTTFGSWMSAAESVAQTYFRDYHVDVMIARPFGFVGPGQPFDPALGFNVGSGDCCVDLLHVDDVAAAYVQLLDSGKPNEVYNVCCGQRTPMGELNSPASSGGVKGPKPGATAFGPILGLCGDKSKLSGLGWSPKYDKAATIAAYQAATVQPVGKPTATAR